MVLGSTAEIFGSVLRELPYIAVVIFLAPRFMKCSHDSLKTKAIFLECKSCAAFFFRKEIYQLVAAQNPVLLAACEGADALYVRGHYFT